MSIKWNNEIANLIHSHSIVLSSEYLVWWGFVCLYYSLLATHQEFFHDDGQVLQPELLQLRLQEHHLSPPYNSQQNQNGYFRQPAGLVWLNYKVREVALKLIFEMTPLYGVVLWKIKFEPTDCAIKHFLSIMISRLCLKISILIRWLIRNFMKEDFRKLIYWYKKSRIDIEGHFGWTSFCSVLGVGLILIFGISELCKYLLTIKSMLMITFWKRSISLLFFKAILENIDIDEKILKNIDIEEKVSILANGSPLRNPHTCCSPSLALTSGLLQPSHRT